MSFAKTRFGRNVTVVLPLIIALLFPAGSAKSAQTLKKSSLSVLFVGVNPHKPLSTVDLDTIDTSYSDTAYPQRRRKWLQDGTEDWAKFLKKYFHVVKVVYGEDYNEVMSSKYDVTIFDTVPPLLRDVGTINPETGERISTRGEYLSKNYRAATIMIGEPAGLIGEGRQLQIDSLCQCLGGHALGMKLDHPIFNRPYKVDIRLEQVKTPDNYKGFYAGRNLGLTMPMWRVQTESYRDGKGFPVGMVSMGYGFDNGVDAEWISGGHSDKGVESTAIGRHANFLLWGFAASPSYLTPSARLVFINAVHYIAHYRGVQQTTHRIEGVALRSDLQESLWLLSDEGSAHYVDLAQKVRKQDAELRRQALAKKRVGKPLDGLEQALVGSTDQPSEKPSAIRGEIILEQPADLRKMFGDEFAAYEKYYAKNMGYFFSSPGGDFMAFDVDQDAKSLGIANDDIRLIDTAVKMLKKGDRKDKQMARRVLLRYTMTSPEKFPDASTWTDWLKKNRGRLYFSEGDGYKWIVIPEKSAAWLKQHCDQLHFSECDDYGYSATPGKSKQH